MRSRHRAPAAGPPAAAARGAPTSRRALGGSVRIAAAKSRVSLRATLTAFSGQTTRSGGGSATSRGQLLHAPQRFGLRAQRVAPGVGQVALHQRDAQRCAFGAGPARELHASVEHGRGERRGEQRAGRGEHAAAITCLARERPRGERDAAVAQRDHERDRGGAAQVGDLQKRRVRVLAVREQDPRAAVADPRAQRVAGTHGGVASAVTAAVSGSRTARASTARTGRSRAHRRAAGTPSARAQATMGAPGAKRMAASWIGAATSA